MTAVEQHRLMRQALASASLLAIAWAASSAQAQEAPAELDTVVVTASRIQSGFEAPTPVTVVSADEIKNAGAPNVAAYLNTLPSFTATVAPASTGQASRNNGANYIDLRGLGPNRTLLLVDSRRHVPTSSDGTVNLNVVPSLAISRVDVVTGGASAAWGADAVSGVVNIVLDDQLVGVRAQAQYGVSQRGDAINYRLGGAFGGRFADDRGHVMFAFEYERDRGIGAQSDRSWGRERWGIVDNNADRTRTDGIPARLITRGVNLYVATEGGLILGPGPIANTAFGPGGTLLTYAPGVNVAPPYSVDGDGANMGQYAALSVPYERFSLFGRSRYDLSDKVQAYFEGSYAHTRSVQPTVQSFDFPITIRADNPYIPAALRTRLTANNISSFGLYRLNTDLGFVTADSTYDTYRVVGGLKGDLNADWSWDAYYQYGRTNYENRQLNNRIQQNYRYAVDAVVNPASGAVVCRATLTGQAPGCAPLNLFGAGSPSQAGIAYVNGTGFLHQTFEQKVAAASIQGRPLQLPAGPLEVAFGAEYREESVASQADELSQNDAFLIVNAKPVSGAFNVKEAFAEAVVPLVRDAPFAHSLEVNAAARYTDYSTTGSVTTWKVGGNWSPFEDLRFRGVRSRDIRAPNIAELFTSTRLSFANVNDPVRGGSPFIQVITQGNRNLAPEKADTTTIGVAYSPSWVSGLRMSVDWYNIDIAGAINTLSPQVVVNLCAAGNSALCSAVTRSANGDITAVTSQQFNVARLETTGIDFEVAYRRSLAEHLPAIGGDVSLRWLGSFVQDRTFSPDGRTKLQKAGEVNPNDTIPLAAPNWRWTAQAGWERGPVTLNLTSRYVGKANYDNTYTAEDINDNTVKARLYFDLSGRYRLNALGRADLELSAGVRNLLDKDPPPVPINFIDTYMTNPYFYDVVGRFFFAGVNAKF